MSEIMISRTAYSTGWGSDHFKTVAGLTPDERQHVRAGGIVLMVNCPPAHGRHGTTVRQVYENGGRFYHKLPKPADLVAAGLQDE